MNKSIILISVGVLNIIHGLFHVIQFVQSILLVTYAMEHEHGHESWIDKVMHSPIFALVWAVVGALTLIIGIRDYRHHKRCNKEGHGHEH